MKQIHYLYIASLASLIACSSEERIQTTDHTSGPIELSAGIVENSSNATTRTDFEDTHQALTQNTQLALQISGTWTGHDPVNVVHTTTATVGSETSSGSKINSLTCSPIIYWEDYGSADVANAETGRAAGLTIYGAAVNGKTTAPTVSNYSALSWTLPADQTTNNNTSADKDLLISNNVKGVGNTYLFKNRNLGKLLEFTHALSKITVNLKAGNGFGGTFGSATPEVKLTGDEGDVTTHAWAYTTGTVNITDGTVSSQGNASVITMWQATSATTDYNITKEALIIPGNLFSNDNDIIVRIKVADNIYYIKAQNIRTAMSAAGDTDYKTKAGKNYIINVLVHQTGISVSATVTNWTDVSAAQVAPVINISGSYGTPDVALGDETFSLYRSTSLNSGYSSSPASLLVNNFYAQESAITKSEENWTMSPQLYWPDHKTHYQFRGVWPQTVTTAGDGILTSPRVEKITHSTTEYQVIKVKNEKYVSGQFPSDLQIARPEIAEGTQCTNTEPGHTTTYLYSGGICATEGTITLNFRYMMSQVEVELTTTDNTLNDAVTLTNAKVELINVHNTGYVKLGDRGVIFTDAVGDYTLDPITDNTVENYNNKRLSAIIPQALTYDSNNPLAATNVKFRITIYHDGDTNTIDDIYEADINPILQQGSSSLVAPNGAWERGNHYKYKLMLSKTKVQVTATLANWTTVNATQDIWF